MQIFSDKQTVGYVFLTTNTTTAMKKSATTFTEKTKDRLITKQMVARRLSVSVRTVDRMSADGLLEKIFIGPSPRFRESEIDQIVSCGR